MYHEDVPPLRRNRPYILSVGAIQPRKNYAMLFRAFARVRELVKEPLDLLIIGQRGWMWETIEKEARLSPFSKDIHLLGFVPESEMPSYYAGAACVAVPSLYEGFGLPVIEAMACGAPVVTSNTSCFPEVAGDAAVLLDPADHNLWGETITELLRDTHRLNAMRRASLRQSAEFSWPDAARQTMMVYQTLLYT
jgi:glycosyltransferase involved in cell wall biosynthesis